jgi:hypothetical protein
MVPKSVTGIEATGDAEATFASSDRRGVHNIAAIRGANAITRNCFDRQKINQVCSRVRPSASSKPTTAFGWSAS